MKKVVSLALTVVMLVSMFAISASAQTYFWLGSNSYSYNRNTYTTCQLSNTRKQGKVKVTLVSTGPLTVKMTDSSGRHLWSENYSIRPNSWNNGARTYTLGNNYSVFSKKRNPSTYRLYFKSTNGKGSGSCSVKAAGNCKVW